VVWRLLITWRIARVCTPRRNVILKPHAIGELLRIHCKPTRFKTMEVALYGSVLPGPAGPALSIETKPKESQAPLGAG